MNKAELIARIKEAADLYRDGRYYESFQLIQPVHGKVNHEKVEKLYRASRIKVLTALHHLIEEERYGRVLDLYKRHLQQAADPEIEVLAQEAENRNQEPRPEPMEISADDFGPTMEDSVTEIMSDSWIQAVADEETESMEGSETRTSEAAGAELEVEPDDDELDAPSEPEFESEAESDELDINELIQRGVSLYEVGDVQNALKMWEHGLSLEPDNVILKEYIANARRELHMEEPEEETASETPAPAEPSGELDRDELNRIVAIGRAGEVEKAMRELDQLTARTGELPEIIEAKDYLSSLELDYGVSTAVARSKELLENRRASDAVNLLEKQLGKFPGNETLEDALRHARQAQSKQTAGGMGSLELDFDAKGEEETTPPPPPVTPDKPAAQKRRTVVQMDQGGRKRWMIPVIVVASLIVLAVLAYLLVPQIRLQQFYRNFRNEQQPKTAEASGPTTAREEDQRARRHQELVEQAKRFYNQRRYLFSYYLFLHANSLLPLSETDQQFLAAARNEMQTEINERQLNRNAERAMQQERYDDAISSYYTLLSAQPDNIGYKKKLIDAYEQAGIQSAFQGKGELAREYFEYGEILDPANPVLKKHKEVASRFISGLITRNQVRQWFYFFR